MEGSFALRAKRRHTIPDDFHVTDAMRLWARQETPLVGLSESAQFIDWHTSRGTTMCDWVRGWQVWMRRAQADRERDRARASPDVVHGPGHRLFDPDDHD